MQSLSVIHYWCEFSGVYIQEDLMRQRTKLFIFLKNHATEKSVPAKSSDTEGGTWCWEKVVIENAGDLFKLGIWYLLALFNAGT